MSPSAHLFSSDSSHSPIIKVNVNISRVATQYLHCETSSLMKIIMWANSRMGKLNIWITEWNIEVSMYTHATLFSVCRLGDVLIKRL